jgi:hypothetical protein
MGISDLLESLTRRNEFQLNLTQVRLHDSVSGEREGEKKFLRQVTAIGTMRNQYSNTVSVAGSSIETFPTDVLIVFVPTQTYMTWKEPLGAVKFGNNAAGGRLNLTLTLPMELRHRFLDRNNLPRVHVTLDGFRKVAEHEKIWDTASDQFLYIVECDLIDETIEATEASQSPVEEQETLATEILKLLAEVDRRFRKWETAALWMFVALIIVLLSRSIRS